VNEPGAGRRAPHPGPSSLQLPRPIADAIVAHVRADTPNEACGIVIGSADAADGGEALRYEIGRNRAASPVRYELDPDDVRRLAIEADDAGHVFWAIVHSHVRSPAVPSTTDIERATWWSRSLHVLVSLAEDQADPVTGAPSLRGWWIVDGAIREVTLVVA
jgi:[CysO sulfur-carrier protein]-S-L-cysteine hydrolase